MVLEFAGAQRLSRRSCSYLVTVIGGKRCGATAVHQAAAVHQKDALVVIDDFGARPTFRRSFSQVTNYNHGFITSIVEAGQL
jgi:hypothetical protein